MDLSELHRVQRQERSTDSLQELRESFYADVAAYLEDLRETRAAAAEEAADPFRSARVSELTSEIETAEHVAEAIYQRRIGKLVDEASLVATGNGETTSGLTAGEQALFDALVERLRANRASVLGQFRGDVAVPEPERTDPTGRASPSDEDTSPEARDAHPPDEPIDDAGPNPADAMGGDLGDAAGADSTDTDQAEQPKEGETTDEPGSEDDVERTTVRMTADVGEIFGVDAESYELNRDDVVDLPRENADPLVDRDVAEKVE